MNLSVNPISSVQSSAAINDPSHDAQYTDFLDAEKAFRAALEAAKDNPNVATIALLEAAASNLQDAETALKATGIKEDTSLATIYDAMIGTFTTDVMSGDAKKIQNQLDAWSNDQKGQYLQLENSFNVFEKAYPNQK